MASFGEKIKTLSDREVQRTYRIHSTISVGFAAIFILIGLATHSIVVPGLLGLFIVVGNGYLASQCKQELDRRAGG